ncbi:hypothetical protein D1007_53019 [Hordeum vulgare]|nr:hypothetical protein D1007_53019 [Hordeum vulgare]
MAPTKKSTINMACSSKNAPTVEIGSSLLPSTITSESGLTMAPPMESSKHYEGGATNIWMGSRPRHDLGPTMVSIFFHSFFTEFVSPFSNLLLTILEHYKIHILHLHPNSVLVLALFAYLYEAFLGVMSSVVLF